MRKRSFLPLEKEKKKEEKKGGSESLFLLTRKRGKKRGEWEEKEGIGLALCLRAVRKGKKGKRGKTSSYLREKERRAFKKGKREIFFLCLLCERGKKKK